MTINPKLRAQQIALNSAPAYRKFIKIVEDSDGTISYLNIATGQPLRSLEDAFASVETLGLVDYRLFSPRPGGGIFENFATTQGANQLESEILVINRYLQDALTDPQKRQTLQNLDLQHLIGTSINGRMYKFNTQGKKDIVDLVSSQFPMTSVATAALTDEGYTLMQYVGADGSEISGRSAKHLQLATGVSPIRKDFLKQLLQTDDYTSIAKLAKRMQGTISPRNVSLGENFIQSFLETPSLPLESRILGIGGVAGQLELMLRDRGIEGDGIRPSDGLVVGSSDLRRGDSVLGFGRTPGYKLSEVEKLFLNAGALEGDFPQRADISNLEKIDQSLTLRRKRMLEQMVSTYGFSEPEIDQVAQLWEQATTNANAKAAMNLAAGNDPGTLSQNIYSEFQDLVKNLFNDNSAQLSASNMENRSLQNRINSMLNGLDKSRDGQIIITPDFLRQVKSAYEQQIEGMLRLTDPLSRNQVEDLTAFQKQVEAMNKALEKIGKGDIIVRINFGEGQFKAEGYVVPDRIATLFAEASPGKTMPFVIGDITNLKPEVGARAARNIVADIGEQKPGVFSDPLMFLYHREYFSQPQMIQSMTVNATEVIERSNDFMRTGLVPTEIMTQLQEESSVRIGGKNLPDRLKITVDRLDPVSRASHLRKKQEADEILRLMASGSDPRQIPQMVRRINDFFNASVVRSKNGRADVVMPTAESFSLRTLESRLATGEDFFRSTSFSVSVPGDPSATINFANFRIKGKALLMAGDSATRYHHSLGGFDLDDKGIPFMSTFRDSSGRQRLSFMTLRQPTSFQESLAMTADLTDPETVRQLFKNNTRFIEALTDPTVLSTLGIDSSSLQYNNLVKMVSEDNIRLDNLNYDEIEDMIIKVSNSNAVYPQGLPSLTGGQIARMAKRLSPSALGTDRLTSGGTPLSEFMLEIGLDPSKDTAFYDSDLIFQIFKKQSESRKNDEVLSKISLELGFDVTKEEAVDFLNQTGARYRPGMENKVAAIMTEVVESIMQKSASSTVEEGIGLFISRQAAAVSVLESSRSILESELGITKGSSLYNAFQASAGIMTLSASDVVDITKQVGKELDLTDFGIALSRAMEELDLTEEMVENTLKAYMSSTGQYTVDQINNSIQVLKAGEIKLGLDPLGQQMLRAHAGVGFVRGKQIADQIASGTAPGSVDRSLLFRTRTNLV
jgi:hypothetical protein